MGLHRKVFGGVPVISSPVEPPPPPPPDVPVPGGYYRPFTTDYGAGVPQYSDFTQTGLLTDGSTGDTGTYLEVVYPTVLYSVNLLFVLPYDWPVTSFQWTRSIGQSSGFGLNYNLWSAPKAIAAPNLHQNAVISNQTENYLIGFQTVAHNITSHQSDRLWHWEEVSGLDTDAVGEFIRISDFRFISLISANCVCWLSFDETAGNRIDNVNGYIVAADGGFGSGTVGSGTGQVAGAIAFDGTQRAIMAYNANFDGGGANLFYTFRIKLTDVSTIVAVFGKRSATLEYQLYFENVSKRFIWFVNDSIAGNQQLPCNTFGDILVDTWYFVCVGVTTGGTPTMKISINGGAFDSLNISGGPINTNGALYFGDNGGGAPMKGLIDDFRTFRRVLDPTNDLIPLRDLKP